MAHALHMFTARVASEPGGRKCATARKSRLATPNFFNVHTPASTLRTRVSVKNVPWGSDRARGGRRARAHVLPSPAAGKGLTQLIWHSHVRPPPARGPGPTQGKTHACHASRASHRTQMCVYCLTRGPNPTPHEKVPHSRRGLVAVCPARSVLRGRPASRERMPRHRAIRS